MEFYEKLYYLILYSMALKTLLLLVLDFYFCFLRLDRPVEGVRAGTIDTLPELMAACDGKFHILQAMFRDDEMQRQHLEQVTRTIV